MGNEIDEAALGLLGASQVIAHLLLAPDLTAEQVTAIREAHEHVTRAIAILGNASGHG